MIANTLLTVITPTYNRAHMLPKCYKSLLNQTDKRFIWMVIDDGSVDGTKNLVSGWIKEGNINILYLKKENGGKASALNLGLDNVRTPYVVCLDSDDIFYEDTVEKALGELEEIKNEKTCCGILALRNSPDGTVLGGKSIPSSMEYVKFGDVSGLKSESICFHKTSILCKYRFPEYKGEKFVPPAWILFEVTRNYYFKVSREKLCICEYFDDGLTKNKRQVIKKNPNGYTCTMRQSFEFSKSIKSIVKSGIMYNYGCILSKRKNWLKDAPKKIWAIILRPCGWMVYITRLKQ